MFQGATRVRLMDLFSINMILADVGLNGRDWHSLPVGLALVVVEKACR